MARPSPVLLIRAVTKARRQGDTGAVTSEQRRVPVFSTVLTAAAAVAAMATLTSLSRAARGLPAALGASRTRIRPYATASPHFTDGSFHNTEPSHVISPGEGFSMLPALLAKHGSGHPSGPVPLVSTPPPVKAA